MLKGKIEAAFYAWIKDHPDLPTNLQVLRGTDSEIQARPCAVAICKNGDAAELTGEFDNRFFEVSIQFKSSGELKDKQRDPVQDHNDLAENFFKLIEIDDLGAQLSALVADLTIFDPVEDLGEDPEQIGRSFIASKLLRIYACGADIS